MFSEYQLSLRFGVSYTIDHRHLSKKATLVYSTNSNKKTIFPLKNFQTPPTVFLSLSSSLFQIEFPKRNPDIFWTPATFTLSLSLSSLSNLIPEIKHYSLFHTQTPFHPQLPLPFSRCHSALPSPMVRVLIVTAEHHWSNESSLYILWKSHLLFF